MFWKSWIVKVHSRPRWLGAVGYILLAGMTAWIFSTNLIGTASEFQFRTYRDGSEALVLGKILADAKGTPTGRANLGFVHLGKSAEAASDVLAVYPRLDHLGAVIPVDLNDANWRHGNGTFGSVFLLPRAATASLGYAGDELVPGQMLRFSNGETKSVTKVEASDQYVQVHYSGRKFDSAEIGFPRPIQVLADRGYTFEPYASQYGVQGIAFSWVFRNVGLFASTERLQFLCAALCALVLVLLCREYRLSLANGFGIVFLACMVGSPWIVSIARNLYWVPFLWFLPALIASWQYRLGDRSNTRLTLYLLFFVAIFLKSLAGYEYLPAVVLLALAPFFIDPFLPTPRYRTVDRARIASVLFLLAIAGFIVALLFHARIRADSIFEGLKITFTGDALKYNPLSELAGTVSTGTEVPLWQVLRTYIFDWDTPVLFWIQHPLVFPALIGLACLALAFEYLAIDRARHRDSAMLLATVLASVSWFILMKGHSAVHLHLNYVLWYFGFIPALVFVIIRGLGSGFSRLQASFSSTPSPKQVP